MLNRTFNETTKDWRRPVYCVCEREISRNNAIILPQWWMQTHLSHVNYSGVFSTRLARLYPLICSLVSVGCCPSVWEKHLWGEKLFRTVDKIRYHVDKNEYNEQTCRVSPSLPTREKYKYWETDEGHSRLMNKDHLESPC